MLRLRNRSGGFNFDSPPPAPVNAAKNGNSSGVTTGEQIEVGKDDDLAREDKLVLIYAGFRGRRNKWIEPTIAVAERNASAFATAKTSRE